MIEKSVSLNLPLCSECGGRCCHGSPGVWVEPERFFSIFFAGQRLTVDQLRTKLPELGLVFWEKDGVPIPAPLSLDCGCSFLAADGCRFPLVARPCQCLALIPCAETLARQQGCLCQLPEGFSRASARQGWQDYWLHK